MICKLMLTWTGTEEENEQLLYLMSFQFPGKMGMSSAMDRGVC